MDKIQLKGVIPTKHVPKINVWAAFSSMGTFPLCIFTENMNSEMFVRILEGHLLTQAKVFHQDQWRVAMDIDPKHTSKISKEFLAKISLFNSHGHHKVQI